LVGPAGLRRWRTSIGMGQSRSRCASGRGRAQVGPPGASLPCGPLDDWAPGARRVKGRSLALARSGLVPSLRSVPDRPLTRLPGDRRSREQEQLLLWVLRCRELVDLEHDAATLTAGSSSPDHRFSLRPGGGLLSLPGLSRDRPDPGRTPEEGSPGPAWPARDSHAPAATDRVIGPNR